MNYLHLSRMAVGAAAGLLLGALYPMMLGLGGFNAVPALTAEYGLVGGTLGFAVSNYLGFRQRILRRIAQSEASVSREP
jgi:hypothetical protein